MVRRKDSFITHRAFCDALAEESARLSVSADHHLHHIQVQGQASPDPSNSLFAFQNHISLNPWVDPTTTTTTTAAATQPGSNPNNNQQQLHVIKPESTHHFSPLIFQEPQPPPIPKALITSPFQNLHVSSNNLPSSNAATSAPSTTPHLSATALLQKAATFGATSTQININNNSNMVGSHLSSPDFLGFAGGNLATWQNSSDRFTRDFLGLTGSDHHHHHHHQHHGGRGGGGGNIGNVNVSVNVRDMLNYAGGVELQQHFERDQSLLMKPQGFGFAEPASGTWGDC